MSLPWWLCGLPTPNYVGSMSILCHVVVVHEDTKVRGPGVEAKTVHDEELEASTSFASI